MSDNPETIRRLFAAELQFRLASAVEIATHAGKQPLDLPISWSHGKHIVEYKEIALRPDQAVHAAWHLYQSATFLMAVAIKDAIKSVISNPKTDSDQNIRDAYQIARLIRNAFTHSPFHPTWSIDPDCQNCNFEVKDILSLNTTDLHGVAFDWRQYGGPLAILRLCQFVRFEILKDSGIKPLERAVPRPKTIYFRQGNLILKKTKKLPKGAKRVG